MDRRYQVFVSSTFVDLQQERQEVMQALLELDCFPAGMELFPAANDDQWTLIRRVIDDCDYYIVVVGGRYGSVNSDGMSFTEMEYRYALKRDKPIIAFVHADPDALPVKRSERDPEALEKLSAFRALVMTRMVKTWTTPADLGSVVSRSLIKLIKDSPQPGWVKAVNLPDESAAQEILRLRNELNSLTEELEATRAVGGDTTHLAQGEDTFRFTVRFRATSSGGRSENWGYMPIVSWNELFSAIAPLMIDEAEESALRDCVSDFIKERAQVELNEQAELVGRDLSRFQLSDGDFQQIKVQLRALGLIQKSSRVRSVNDRKTYWTLTTHGDLTMTNLLAIPRETVADSATAAPGDPQGATHTLPRERSQVP